MNKSGRSARCIKAELSDHADSDTTKEAPAVDHRLFTAHPVIRLYVRWDTDETSVSVFGRLCNYYGRPTRRSKSLKRGSECKLSNSGSTFRKVRSIDRSA